MEGKSQLLRALMISVLLARWLISLLSSASSRLPPLRVPRPHVSSSSAKSGWRIAEGWSGEYSLLFETQLFANEMLTFHPISLITVAMAAE